MTAFSQSLSRIFKGSLRAFRSFPASVGFALAFAVLVIVRIQIDRQHNPYIFIINCLLWAFAVGSVFSLASITAAQSRFSTAKAFLTANLLGIIAAVITFLGLYLFGSSVPEGYGYTVISELAAVRAGAAILVSLIAFVLLAAYPKGRLDFPSSLFMVHKSFFIALIYGAVLIAGASGVARAVQALLYYEMSGKVYMYIAVFAGFLAYTVFIGYFPDFRKNTSHEHFETAQKQPRFIEVLFVYIMVPLILALTLVLLIWAGKTAFSGMWASFVLLSGIAAAYTIGGLWLHAMTAGHKSGSAKLYRLVYPAASLVILVFEAWAVAKQLMYSGLKLTEYVFILIWIITAAGGVLLLILKAKAHTFIAVLTCVIVFISVLPSVGYNALPVTAQTGRLEALLAGEGMLEGERLRPAAIEPERAVREAITDAVTYLANTQDTKLPIWFDRSLNNNYVFKAKLGFDQIWPSSDNEGQPIEYIMTYLTLAPASVDISAYDWAVNPQDIYGKGDGSAVFDGSKGIYRIYWESDGGDIPTVKIMLNDSLVIEQDFSSYIGGLTEKYPPKNPGSFTAPVEDMSMRIETQQLDVLLVFNQVNISADKTADTLSYWFDISGLYLKENS